MPPLTAGGRMASAAGALLRPLPAPCLLAAAALALVTSFLPSGPIGGCLEELGVSGAARRYTDAVHDRIAPRLRLAGGALLLAGLLAWRYRRGVVDFLAEAGRGIFADLREALARVGAVPGAPAAGPPGVGGVA